MIKSERAEALAVSTRLMTSLVSFPLSSSGATGADLRSAVGKFLSNFFELIVNRTLGTELFACFEQARLAGATINSMSATREAMLAETPVSPLSLEIVNSAIIFSFVEQCQIISRIVFNSRTEAGAMLDGMSVIIESIKLNKADSFISNDYQNFVALAALLIQHLSATERQLPRIVKYSFAVSYPALTLSNRIYGDGSRSDELIGENKTVHPAFMQRNIMALSS
jgi:hypothetical protein